MSSLLKYLQELAQWLLDALLWLPLKVWEIFSDAFAAIIEAIPVPEWLEQGDPFGWLPDYIAYFLQAFMIPEGMAIITGAYLIRFMIRRIPFIG